MTKENEKLRDCLREVESIITNALRSQPEGDNECKIHLTKAVKDVLNLVYDAKSQMPDGSKYAMEGMGYPSAFDRPSNTAAKREALSDACYAMFNFLKVQNGGYEEMANALDKAKAALAAPARNCDLPLVVDGPANNNADKAWLVFKRHNPDAYFDVSGLLRCIDWLFAPATEQKGEMK